MTDHNIREIAGWQDMESAPRDGSWFQAEIPGHGSDNVLTWADDVGCWAFATEQEPPDCWTDGYCWGVNEDNVASVKPTRWKYLPVRQSLGEEAGGL